MREVKHRCNDLIKFVVGLGYVCVQQFLEVRGFWRIRYGERRLQRKKIFQKV